MDAAQTLAIFDAIGHPTRLEVLRLLSGEDDGLPAGEIARRLGVVQNTMSAHLKRLSAAALVEVDRVGTTITYRLNKQTTASAAKALADL